MTDIEKAIQHLEDHSICLCRDGVIITDDSRGISSIMRFISEGKDLSGYSVADVIVGKAAAMLFVKAGIISVYGKTMSESGRAFLDTHGIPCSYNQLTEHIINCQGTDICPMEKTVTEINDVDNAYKALGRKLEQMKNNKS